MDWSKHRLNPKESDIQIGDYFQRRGGWQRKLIINVGPQYVNYEEWHLSNLADDNSEYIPFGYIGFCERKTIRRWCGK